MSVRNSSIEMTSVVIPATDITETEVKLEVSESPTPIDSTNEKEIKVESKAIEESSMNKGTMNSFGLAMNIMKGIAGTGCIALPIAVKNVGIIWAMVLFVLVSAGYILASYQLILCNDNLGEKKTMGKGIIKTNNQYAFLCYITMGKGGYYIFNAAVIITLCGASIGTIIAMTDFICEIPSLIKNPNTNRIIMQIILTIIVILLSLLKDPSLLVGVSSFGMISLILSLILLLIYGLINSSFTFKLSYLKPISLEGFLTNLGIFVHSLAFILFLLSQTRHLKKEYQSKSTITIGIAVSIMAIIYSFMGIVFFLLFVDENDNISNNILLSFPKGSSLNIIVDIFMVITTIGSVPLYMGPICEIIEVSFGDISTNKIFIKNKKCILFRIIIISLISFFAFIFPFFSEVLGFNILFNLI